MPDKKRKEVEQSLWAIKEATWHLYDLAPLQPGILEFMKLVTDQTNIMLSSLGFDPGVRVFFYRAQEGD